MSIEIKSKYIVIGFLIALLIAFLFGGWLGLRRENRALKRLESANNVISVYKSVLHGDSVEINQTKQELSTERQARKALEITNRELKAMNIKQANELSQLKFRIDTLLEDVVHNGQVITIHDTVQIERVNDKNALLLPFQFKKKDNYLDLLGNFDSKGKLDIAIKIDAQVDVITGIGRDKQPLISISTDNPYIKTIGVKSFKTDKQKPKRFGIGAQAGYGFMLKNPVQVSPYIGFGVSVNVIRF